jgi:hypothetical protein
VADLRIGSFDSLGMPVEDEALRSGFIVLGSKKPFVRRTGSCFKATSLGFCR